jgi:integrase
VSKGKLESKKIGPFVVRPRVRDGKVTGAWVVDVPARLSQTGKRERPSYDTKTLAIAAAERMRREAQLGSAVRGRAEVRPAGITFQEFADRWIVKQSDRVATGKKRASSLVTNGYQLKALAKHFCAMDITRIDANEIENYQKKRTVEDHCRPPTINSEVATLVQVLSWAHDLRLIETVPPYESIPVPTKRVHIPSPEETVRIISHLTSRTGLLARFLAETGCRKDEAFSLEWSDLVPRANLVSIRRKAEFTPKSRHSERDIPISPTLMVALMQARAEDVAAKASEKASEQPRYVFPGRFGAKRTDARKALASAVRKAEVRRDGEYLHLTTKIFRKAMASWLHLDGVSDRLLQPRMGHAPGSRVTSQIYVQVTTEDQRAIAFDLSQLALRKATPEGFEQAPSSE